MVVHSHPRRGQALGRLAAGPRTTDLMVVASQRRVVRTMVAEARVRQLPREPQLRDLEPGVDRIRRRSRPVAVERSLQCQDPRGPFAAVPRWKEAGLLGFRPRSTPFIVKIRNAALSVLLLTNCSETSSSLEIGGRSIDGDLGNRHHRPSLGSTVST